MPVCRLAIGIAQQDRAAPCRPARRNVGGQVAHHVRAGQVDSELAGCSQEQTGPRLATITQSAQALHLRLRVVKAVVDSIEVRALAGQFLVQKVVQSP